MWCVLAAPSLLLLPPKLHISPRNLRQAPVPSDRRHLFSALGARPSDGVIRLSCADRLLLPCQTLLSVPGLVPKSAWLLLASCYLCPLHHHRRQSSYCPDIFCLLRTQTSVEYLCSL